MKTSIVFGLAGMLAIGAFGAERTKQIYAHYMACWPAGIKSMQHTMEQAHKTKADSASLFDAVGGRIVNYPLLPQRGLSDADESAELEIKRAIRGGFDGFAIDAWAGGDEAKETLDHLFAAAERMKVPFYLTICMDPACHGRNEADPGNQIEKYADSIKWLLGKHGKSPNLARRNGKPLIFGYYSCGIYMTDAWKKLSMPERAQKTKDAYDRLEKLVGQDLYLHFDYDYAGKKDLEHAAFVGKNYDAVGGFLGADHNWRMEDDLIDAFKKGGAEWSMPMWFQYNNKMGNLLTGKGTDILRANWEKARKTDSTLIQFVTWNDYGEETSIAPGYETNYTILGLNRYFIDWWKQGTPPKADKDVIHVMFRKNMPNTLTYPFHQRRTREGCVEIVTILKSAATVNVEGFGSYEAPGGLFVRQFPMKVGRVHAEIKRNGATAVSVTTHEEITDLPFRENNTLACFSSDFEEEWAKDFPDDEPLYYSEYGDADGDGLPNWFEMVWFGKFPLMATATNAVASADSDSDGLSNSEEWRRQKNPLVKEGVYKSGFVWNFDEIYKRGTSFNPDRDANETPVWHYLHKIGDVGKIVEDGCYVKNPDCGQNVPYAGLFAHFSPVSVPGRKHVYGWIARRKDADGKMIVCFTPRKECMQVLAWQSPTDGVVTFSAKGKVTSGQVWNQFSVMKNDEVLFRKKVKNGEEPLDLKFDEVKVRKGDFIYICSNCAENGATVELSHLQIMLQ